MENISTVLVWASDFEENEIDAGKLNNEMIEKGYFEEYLIVPYDCESDRRIFDNEMQIRLKDRYTNVYHGLPDTELLYFNN